MTVHNLKDYLNGAIMKTAIVALFAFGIVLPVGTSYGWEPDELDILLVPQRDQNVGAATLTERSKIIISRLNTPVVPENRTTEKPTTPLAEPQDTLHGLKGIMVLIEDIESEVEDHGLTKILLKNEVESRLRQADIIVLTRDEAFNMLGKPYLYLSLTTHNTGVELYSYSIRMEFNQDVCMVRDPSVRASATTWIANVVGIVGTRNLPAVAEDATQLTDKFIHDYLAANQK